MTGQAVHGLLDGLAQGRVSMHIAGDLVDGEVPLLGEGEFGEEFGDVGADKVATDEFAVLGVADELDEAVVSPRPWDLPFAVNGNLVTLTS